MLWVIFALVLGASFMEFQQENFGLMGLLLAISGLQIAFCFQQRRLYGLYLNACEIIKYYRTQEHNPQPCDPSNPHSRGFTGLGIQQFDLDSLKAFAANAEVTSGRFKIYSALWFVNTDAVFTTAAITDLKPKLAELQKMKAYLWMVFDTNSGNAVALTNAVANARKVADACALYGVTLVIYPHGGCAFYKAEQAKGYLPQINRANVKLSIHLCHELMAGNGSRIAAVVDAVKSDIVLASVCGSDTAINPDDNWASQIQPLDRGDYDVAPFLQALAAAGYAGPMELHTYNLGDPGVTPTAADHLTRSMKKWRTLVAPTAHVP